MLAGASGCFTVNGDSFIGSGFRSIGAGALGTRFGSVACTWTTGVGATLGGRGGGMIGRSGCAILAGRYLAVCCSGPVCFGCGISAGPLTTIGAEPVLRAVWMSRRTLAGESAQGCIHDDVPAPAFSAWFTSA